MLKRNLGTLILAVCIISLSLICTATASTMTSSESSTITVGKSGTVDYLTTNYGTDSACIQAALDAAKSGDTITIREGDYYITERIYQKGKSLNIIGEGEVTLHLQTADGYYNGLFFEGSSVTRGTLAKDALEGSTSVVLTDASNVHPNDLIKIWKNVQWCPLDYPDQMTGETYYVQSVSGNVVTLNQPLLRDYRLSDTVQTEIYRPIEMHIQNIRIQDKDATASRMAVVLRYCKDSSITGMWIKDSGLAAISLYTCFNVDVNNNEVYNSILPGSGYGVGAWSGSAFINIENNYIENCRHTITGNTNERKSLNRDVFIANNTLIGAEITGSNVIDAHPVTINYVVTRNEIYPKLPYFFAFLDGAKYSEFSENVVHGGYGAVARRGSVNDGVHIIKNNVMEGMTGHTYQGLGSGVGDTLIIKDNIQNGGQYGVIFSGESFRNIIINRNEFRDISRQGVYQKFLINGVNLEISENTFENIGRDGIYIDGNGFTNGDVKIQNNNLINVNPSNPGSEITIKNIQDASISGNQIVEESGDINLNHAPVMETVTDQVVEEGNSLDFTVKATDIDGDSLTYSVSNLPMKAEFDSMSGMFSWTPGEGQAGTYKLTFTASDGELSDSDEATITVVGKENPASDAEIYDNRLREASPDEVIGDKAYIDIGRISTTGRYRDVIWFNLSEYSNADTIDKATLSLYWYYPANNERAKDTIVEIYRPEAWNPNYVSWNNRDMNTPWVNAGGDWFDRNNVAQGSTPYATITIKGSELPDNRYYELDVTELVREYVSGNYENTGFLIKAATEDGDYIAFYSTDCGIEGCAPKLDITQKTVTGPVVLSDLQDSRLREGSPDTVFNDVRYIDLGGRDGVGGYRDLLLFDLSELGDAEMIEKATLSLFWYYPERIERPEDTVVEIYRPEAWDPDSVTWNNKDLNTQWANAGGDWYDLNNVAQGNTPYATITIKGSDVPDSSYHEIDVTELVKEYVSGEYENTGFLIKARTESGNYMAFYSSDCGIEGCTPKLDITQKPVTSTILLSNLQDSRLREGSPDTVFNDVRYVDLGGRDGVGGYRGLLLFDLSELDDAESIESADLSLFWYYPAGIERPEDTIVEIYRPETWNPNHVTWNSRDLNTPWENAGGDWYDLNNVAQGSKPYATITIRGSDIPDNSYHELDVTELVKEYVSGEYKNNGFLVKARTESGNYVAFCSSDYEDENQRPTLKVSEKA